VDVGIAQSSYMLEAPVPLGVSFCFAVQLLTWAHSVLGQWEVRTGGLCAVSCFPRKRRRGTFMLKLGEPQGKGYMLLAKYCKSMPKVEAMRVHRHLLLRGTAA
jgi:hypothetical protein